MTGVISTAVPPHAVYELLSTRLSQCIERQGIAKVEEIIVGLTWTLCRVVNREGDCHGGLAMSPGFATRTLPWPGTLSGRPLAELATWLYSWEPFESCVGMAATNAVINAADNAVLDTAQAVDGRGNLALFDHFLPQLRGKRIAVVGRYPGLERYSTEFDMVVLELNPQAGDLPAHACEYLLPQCEWVFLTATSLTNKSFPRLAELSRSATLVLMGPTVPWVAELAQFGVDYLAGVKVVDSQGLRQTVAEGGGTRIFEGAVRYAVQRLG